MINSSSNSKRIAKNTLALYFRMIISMIVSLYTSRVVLATLGVVDFGIMNVVGGFVGMFSMISSSLSGAIGRFTNYEMGKGNKDRLNLVFSTSINVQIIISAIVFILAETIGLWFVNEKMVIPAERMSAAHWVYQCTIATFIVGLLSVPYNAATIAHERMKAFAYVSLIEVFLKLGFVYLLVISPFDKLKLYTVLLLALSIVIRFIYSSYCTRNFEECHYRPIFDKTLAKTMFGYSSWTFIGNTSSLLRSQGVNIVINLFCGPAVNAARGIAVQVNHALYQFISNFTTALNPQIIQNYASGNYVYCNKLVFTGSRLSYYMLFLLALPVMVEADFILSLWLTEIPSHAVVFVRLTLFLSLCVCISTPISRLMVANGDIRNYQIVVGGLQLLNLPIDYTLMKWCNMPPEGTYIVAITLEITAIFARLFMIKKVMSFNSMAFIKDVLSNIIAVSAVALIVPMTIIFTVKTGWCRLLLVVVSTLLSTSSTIYYVGCNKDEREFVKKKTAAIFHRIRN